MSVASKVRTRGRDKHVATIADAPPSSAAFPTTRRNVSNSCRCHFRPCVRFLHQRLRRHVRPSSTPNPRMGTKAAPPAEYNRRKSRHMRELLPLWYCSWKRALLVLETRRHVGSAPRVATYSGASISSVLDYTNSTLRSADNVCKTSHARYGTTSRAYLAKVRSSSGIVRNCCRAPVSHAMRHGCIKLDSYDTDKT